ncbi:MAG: HlyD family efflux transporter periplasmic adaptor subunit [Kiritimatiellae bacterium]|nr:HlyD family efflux transporter periplasmic adaptor subunit [Kiritimatiellia bacterium]
MKTRRGYFLQRLPFSLRLRYSWPLLVWLLTVVIAVVLIRHEGNWDSSIRIHGLVGGEPILITPEATARIKQIYVHSGEQVTNNQALIALDTAAIDLNIAGSMLDAYRDAQGFTDSRLTLNTALLRQDNAAADVEARLAEARLELVGAKGELERIHADRPVLQRDYESGLISFMDLNRLTPRMAELEQTIVEHSNVVQILERQYREATERTDVLKGELDTLEKMEGHAIVQPVLSQIQQDAERYRDTYILRAPCDGQVSEISGRTGEVVWPEHIIMRMVPPSIETVTALIPEQRAMYFTPGDRVWVSAVHVPERGRVGLKAVVETLSEEIRMESAQVNIGGRIVPVRTRRATLRLQNPGEARLLAGEAVEVSPTPVRPNSPLSVVKSWFTRK